MTSENHTNSSTTDLAVACVLRGNLRPWEMVIDDLHGREVDDSLYPVKFENMGHYKSMGRVRSQILRIVRSKDIKLKKIKQRRKSCPARAHSYSFEEK